MAGTTVTVDDNTISGNARQGIALRAGTVNGGNRTHYHGSAQPPSA
ncbi:hypothetical protein [Kitasatospora sp. NPDC057198]